LWIRQKKINSNLKEIKKLGEYLSTEIVLEYSAFRASKLEYSLPSLKYTDKIILYIILMVGGIQTSWKKENLDSYDELTCDTQAISGCLES
jgi:hypothetical protein